MPLKTEAPDTSAQVEAAGPHIDYSCDVHLMVRVLGSDANPRVDQVDRDVQSWLASGFELFATHYAGDVGAQGARIIFVLKRAVR